MTSPSSLSSSSEVSFPGKYSTKCTDASFEQTFLLSNLYFNWVYSESEIHPLTKCLNQIVWDWWTRGIFQPKFSWHLNRNLWQMYHFLSSTNPLHPPPSTPRHTNWSPASHLVSRENHQSGFCKKQDDVFWAPTKWLLRIHCIKNSYFGVKMYH